MNDKEHRNLERAGKADTDRILTIPNVLSFFRLALIPVIIVLYAKNEVWWAFGMLVLSGVTDVVDGWVARTYHMVSNFGKAIDPVADKLTQIAVLLCLMPMKCWWVVGILVLKEISIGITSSIGNILALCEENVKETGRPEEKIGRTDKKALLRVSDFLFVKNSKNCAKRRCRNVFLQFLQQGDMRRERRNSDRKNGENSG